jgi:hypothetical protein
MKISNGESFKGSLYCQGIEMLFYNHDPARQTGYSNLIYFIEI